MNFKKIIAAILVISACTFCFASCKKETSDFEDITIKITGDFETVYYINALANEHYFLDVSLLMGNTILYNTVACAGGAIESIHSDMSGATVHAFSIGGATYIIDDNYKVYFEAPPEYGALESAVDYSCAQYIGSGKGMLSMGKEYKYDEFLCKTSGGEECGVKLFTNDNGNLVAIVDYYGGMEIERDVAQFSAEIPEGWLELPEDYTEIDVDTYFEKYYEQ